MTNTRAGTDDGFEVVVGNDGTLTVPAAELARHGMRPGAHLRLVPEHQSTAERKRTADAPAGGSAGEAEQHAPLNEEHGSSGRRHLAFVGAVHGGPTDASERTDDYLSRGFGRA
jgi:hypothetical protein